MQLLDWEVTTGSLSTAIRAQRAGKKYKPFVPGPTIQPQPYSFTRIQMKDAVLGSFGTPCGTAFWGESQTLRPLVIPNRDSKTGPQLTSFGQVPYARAYAKFKEKAYTQAANLTALKERVKTVDMILNRLKQLHKGASALKRGRFREFCKVFGIEPKARHQKTKWTKPKEFGSLWLEYWMGWAPTVGDIYNSVDAYQKPIPDQTIRSGSSHTYGATHVQSGNGARATTNWNAKGTIWIQGSVEVTNPSLHKAQALGLVNPILTAWETTPFSWFFGWFNTLAQTLGQFSDWVGLKLKNLSVSSKTEAVCSWRCFPANLIYGKSFPSLMKHTKEYFWFSRNPIASGVLPTIKPAWRLPNGLSLTRGATLASLLVTIFAPGRK